jgi:hypothetical protein
MAVSALVSNPPVGSQTDLVERNGSCSADVQPLCDDKQLACQMQHRLTYRTLCGEVLNVSISLFYRGPIEMTSEDSRIPVQGLQHGRISHVNCGDPRLRVENYVVLGDRSSEGATAGRHISAATTLRTK